MPVETDSIVQVLLRERLRIAAAAAVVLRDAHAADDVFQQVVLAAIESHHCFHDGEHVFAWAVRAARNRAIDIARRQRLTILPDDVLDLLDGPSGDGLSPSDKVEALRSCMGKLPMPSRQLLQLRYDDGLSGTAIADRLHRSVEAVYQALSRVHRALRACVERQLTAPAPPPKGADQ